MRTSREVKAQHHREIVAAASKMLRRHGIEGTSIADLMSTAGLTHGGFYRHFASKDVLITESTRAAFREILQRYQAHAAKDGPKAALAAYVDDYLDNRHVRAPEDGCPIAAYGPEAARESETVGEVFAEGTEQLMAMIGRGLSCQKEQRQARAVELQALLAGAVVMVRAAGDAKLAQHVLSIARKRARRMIRER